MAKKKPERLDWLRFFPADFIQGTKEMSNEEVGAYIRLLCEAWLNSINGNVKPHVPARTSAILAALPGTTKKAWGRIKCAVLDKFDMITLEVKGEELKVLFNDRLAKEQIKALGDSEDQRKRVLNRYRGSAPVVPGNNRGSTGVLPAEGEEETELYIESERAKHAVGSEVNMAKERQLHKNLARIWQEVKGTPGAHCPYPHWQKEAFEDMARTIGHDVIEDAFRLWANDAQDPNREKYPIDKFVMQATDYLLAARPAQAPALIQEDPQAVADRDKLILELAKKKTAAMNDSGPERNEAELPEDLSELL